MRKFLIFLVAVPFLLPQNKCYAQWQNIWNLPPFAISKNCFVNDTVIYIHATDTTGHHSQTTPSVFRLFRSFDGGISWDSLNAPGFVYSMDFPTIDTGYIGSGSSLYRTFDRGLHWEQMPDSIFNPVFNNILTLTFYNGHLGIASGTTCLTFITNDAGNTWQRINSFANVGCGSITGNIRNGVLWGYGNNGYLFSDDTLTSYSSFHCFENASGSFASCSDTNVALVGRGQSGWIYGYNTFNFGVAATGIKGDSIYNVYHFPEMNGIWPVYRTSSDIYAGCTVYDPNPFMGSNPYFLKSEDNGLSWFLQYTDEVDGEANGGIKNIKCFNDTFCYAATDFAVYKTTNGGGILSSQQYGYFYETTNVKNIYSAYNFSVFPNPSSNIVNIQYTGNIQQVRAYNISGQQFMLTVNNKQADVSNLSPGLYILEVQTREGTVIHAKIVKE